MKDNLKNILIQKTMNRYNAFNAGFIVNNCDVVVGNYLLKCYDNKDIFSSEQLEKLDSLCISLNYGK